MLKKIKAWIAVLNQVIKDCATSAGGDYDPARVIGYGIAVLGGIEFLVLFAYTTVQSGKFDGIQFATGLTGVSAVIAGAAAGVWIKRATENPPAAVSAAPSPTPVAEKKE